MGDIEGSFSGQLSAFCQATATPRGPKQSPKQAEHSLGSFTAGPWPGASLANPPQVSRRLTHPHPCPRPAAMPKFLMDSRVLRQCNRTQAWQMFERSTLHPKKAIGELRRTPSQLRPPGSGPWCRTPADFSVSWFRSINRLSEDKQQAPHSRSVSKGPAAFQVTIFPPLAFLVPRLQKVPL